MSGPGKILILSMFNQPRWTRLVREVQHRSNADGTTTEIFDASSYCFPSASKPSGFKLHTLKAENRTVRALIQTIRHLFYSQQISFFAEPRPNHLLSRYFLAKASQRGVHFHADFNSALRAGDYASVLIPNGRYGLQRIALQIAQHFQLDVVFYEVHAGFPKNHLGPKFFLAAFPVHSRISVQKALKELDVSSFDSSQVFHSWLEPRMLSGSQDNAFASKWGESLSSKAFESSSSETNLFLTSSTDEFQALGQEWQEDKWVDQYEAFEAVIGKLKEKGETNFVLRIHPNLSNKSLRFVRDEISRIRWIKNMHPELVVIGPLSKTNTYSLIAEAKRVVVSLSMAGLESSGLGIPVWCTMANNYDLVADVRRLLNRESITTKNLQPWQVDVSKAHQHVTAALNFGEDYVLSTDVKLRVSNLEKIKAIGARDLIFRLIVHARKIAHRILAMVLLRRM